MAGRRALLGPLNGSLRPKVLFVGEAPGRRGAERTRRPFSGDASGRSFEALLAAAGLSRGEIFITNAVLCCPADDRRNATPATTEINRCLPFLRRTMALLRPPVVATIGTVAMRAVARLVGHDAGCAAGSRLSDVVGRILDGGRFQWVPLYHPSPRVLNTARTLAEQKEDFAALGRLVGQGPGRPRPSRGCLP